MISQVWQDPTEGKYLGLLELLIGAMITKFEAGLGFSSEELAMESHVREAASKELLIVWINSRLPSDMVMSNFVKVYA